MDQACLAALAYQKVLIISYKYLGNLKIEKSQFLYPSMTMCNSYSSFQQKKPMRCGKIFPKTRLPRKYQPGGLYKYVPLLQEV